MPFNPPAPTPLRILVTGSAGLIGQELCAVLTSRGHTVTGLLRRRIPAPGTRHGPGATTLIEGDVAEPGLGLPPETAALLAAELDLVVHCAAVTGFTLPPETYRRVNIGGTANVLGFTAASRPIPLLHVGTAYVCGLAEGAVAEVPAAGGPFNNGYEASKAAAEALVLAARRTGQVTAVARPSVVVGRWTDGATGAFGTIYQLIRLVTEGRIRILPVAPGASLDLVPLDHVVGGLADIAERMADADGRIVHLVSGHPVPLTALLDLADAFPQFQSPRFVLPDRFSAASLGERERRLHGQVVEACAAYLRPSPRFAAANLAALTGRHCPPVDDAFLHRLIAFAISAGFLPQGRVSVRPDNAGRAPAAALLPS